MSIKVYKKINILVILSLSVCLSACATGVTQNIPEVPKTDIFPACNNPVIIGIADDQTGSMRWSGTPSLTTDDLKPLISQIKNCGGEIGVTFVRANSAKPIERLRVKEPPVLPAEPIQNPNEEDYEFADRQDDYRKQLQTRNDKVSRYQGDFQPEIDAYLNGLAPLLAHKPQGSTDLWSCLNRLDVFLSEDYKSWRTKPHYYLIVVSDGEDTMGKENHKFKSDAMIIWVNANAAEKNLKDFPYQRVEKFSAAVDQVLAIEGVK